MDTTKLSSKGQVIIPKQFRQRLHWEAGQELVVVDTGDGVLLKPKTPFTETALADVAGCLAYQGKPKTLEEMEQAIERGAKAQAAPQGSGNATRGRKPGVADGRG